MCYTFTFLCSKWYSFVFYISVNLCQVFLSAVPTEPPRAVSIILDPPTFLSANCTERGVLLQWSPPEAPSSPLTGYVLQVRRDQGRWVILSNNISANQSELLVKGLIRVKICSHLTLNLYKDQSVSPLCFLLSQPGWMQMKQP